MQRLSSKCNCSPFGIRYFRLAYGCKAFFSAIMENSDALSLLSLVGLSILSWHIFPQTWYLYQVGNFIPPMSACPSFSFHFVLGIIRVLRQISTKICIPLARNWLDCTTSLLMTAGHVSSLPCQQLWSSSWISALLVCALNVFWSPLSLSHSSPTCQLSLWLQPFQIRHPWGSRGLVKEQWWQNLANLGSDGWWQWLPAAAAVGKPEPWYLYHLSCLTPPSEPPQSCSPRCDCLGCSPPCKLDILP